MPQEFTQLTQLTNPFRPIAQPITHRLPGFAQVRNGTLSHGSGQGDAHSAHPCQLPDHILQRCKNKKRPQNMEIRFNKFVKMVENDGKSFKRSVNLHGFPSKSWMFGENLQNPIGFGRFPPRDAPKRSHRWWGCHKRPCPLRPDVRPQQKHEKTHRKPWPNCCF